MSDDATGVENGVTPGRAIPHRYGQQDGDLADLRGQRVAIVGYGNLGRSAALNLRDSGLDVVVGSRADEDGARARDEGFAVWDVERAVRQADVVWLALPDEVIPELLAPDSGVRPKPGSLTVLASGYRSPTTS
jgi:ketol-acid reductoisomerase